MGQDTQDIVIDEQMPGAAPGVSGAALLALLPKLMELLAAISSGALSIPQFTVRAFGKTAKVGPIPISYS